MDISLSERFLSSYWHDLSPGPEQNWQVLQPSRGIARELQRLHAAGFLNLHPEYLKRLVWIWLYLEVSSHW